MTHHIIPMHVLAELVVHSYPYKADIHMTLQVRDAHLCMWISCMGQGPLLVMHLGLAGAHVQDAAGICV